MKGIVKTIEAGRLELEETREQLKREKFKRQSKEECDTIASLVMKYPSRDQSAK